MDEQDGIAPFDGHHLLDQHIGIAPFDEHYKSNEYFDWDLLDAVSYDESFESYVIISFWFLISCFEFFYFFLLFVLLCVCNIVSLAHQIIAIRLDKMESKDPKEDKKRHDEDYTAMNDMMKLDDIHDRAKVSIRVKNEALAKVVLYLNRRFLKFCG